MDIKTLAFVGAVVFGAAPAVALEAPAACESLKTLKTMTLKNTEITLAQVVEAGAFTPPTPGGAPAAPQAFRGVPSFCRVAATLRPSSDSDIKVEVWLPVEGWNGKFQAVGNGGWAGVISYPALATAVRRGYATASTDTGHAGNGGDASFGLNHPEKVIDFAYRAVHEMTVTAKSMVNQFYGSQPRRSYWNGCSTGGRQGLMEAQKYPGDFDGIIAGAPANYMSHLQTHSLAVGVATLKDPASVIPRAKYAAVHKAALEACDALDGVKDGVIDDPTRCAFDPKTIQCTGEDGPACLTAPQVDAARAIYATVKTRTGAVVFPGLARGGELGWAGLAGGPGPLVIAESFFKYQVFKNPDWDFKTFDVDTHLALAEKASSDTDATNPNLQPFFDRGGKLLMYHGWADQLISPFNSINYYQSVAKALGGASKVDAALRLFMAPGMGHCAGGDGPNTFDSVTALERWVEQKNAPASIEASHSTAGAVDRTRPLCPYPMVAVYDGSGSTDDAANFTCKAR